MAKFWETPAFNSFINRTKPPQKKPTGRVMERTPETSRSVSAIKAKAYTTISPISPISEINQTESEQVESDLLLPDDVQPLKKIGDMSPQEAFSSWSSIAQNSNNPAYDMLPKDQEGNIPMFSRNLALNDTLYFNQDSGMFTNDPNDSPVYWDAAFDMTLEETSQPVIFDMDFVDQVMPLYTADSTGSEDTTLSSYFNQITPESLQEYSTSTAADTEKTAVLDIQTAEGGNIEDANFFTPTERAWYQNLGIVDWFQKNNIIGTQLNEPFDLSTQQPSLAGLFEDLLSYIGGTQIASSAALMGNEEEFQQVLPTVEENRTIEGTAKAIGLYLGAARAFIATTIRNIFNISTAESGVSVEQSDTGIRVVPLSDSEVSAAQEDMKRQVNNIWQQFLKYRTGENVADIEHIDASDAEKWIIATDYHNQAYELFTAGYTEQAIEVLIKSYRLEDTINGNARNFSYSWFAEPERFEQFLYGKALVELQFGHPLTDQENYLLKQKYEDATIEVIGEIALDLTDLLTKIPIGEIVGDAGAGSAIGRFVSKYGLQDTNILSFPVKTSIGGMKEAWYAAKISDNAVVRWGVNALSQFGGVFKLSIRQQAKNLGNNVDYLIHTFVEGGGAVSKEDFSVIAKLGENVAYLKQIEELPTDEIVRVLQESGEFPSQLLTESRIKLVEDMIDVVNPITRVGTATENWNDIIEAAYKNAVARRTDRYVEAAQTATKRFIRKGKNLTDDEIEAFYRAGQSVSDAAKYTKEEIDALLSTATAEATERALRETTNSDFASALGSIFSGRFKEKNAAWFGSSILQDTVLGKIGANLPQARPIITWMSNAYDNLFGQWINNILTSTGRYVFAYQPAENMLFYTTSFGGKVSNVYDFFREYPDIAKHIDDLPAEARRGFAIDLFSPSGKHQTVTILDLLKEKPKSWIPTPTNYVGTLSRNTREIYAEWLDGFVKGNSLKNTWNALAGLFKPAQILGKTGGDLVNLNETLVQATISATKYIQNWDMVGEPILYKVLDELDDAMRASGTYADDMIEQAKDIITRLWEDSGGSASKFAKQVNALSDVKFLPTLPALDVPGFNATESIIVAKKIRTDFTGFLNAARNNGEEITDEVIENIGKTIKDNYLKITEEAQQLDGITAHAMLNATDTIRPVNLQTSKLLNQLEQGIIPKSLDDLIDGYKISDIIEDAGVSASTGMGRTADDIYGEFLEELRPGTTIPLYPTTGIPEDVVRASRKVQVPIEDTGKINSRTEAFEWDRLESKRANALIQQGNLSSGLADTEDNLAQAGIKYSDVEDQIRYRFSLGRGKLEGVVENLRSMEQQGTITPELRTIQYSLDQLLNRFDQNFSNFWDFTQDVYPGVSKIAFDSTKHASMVLVKDMYLALEENAGNALLKLYDDLKAGIDVVLPTTADMMKWMGFTFKTNDAGYVIGGIYKNARTGVEISFDNLLTKIPGYTATNPILSAIRSSDSFGIKHQEILDLPLSATIKEWDNLQTSYYRISPAAISNLPSSEINRLQEEYFSLLIWNPHYTTNGATYREFLESLLYDELKRTGTDFDTLSSTDILEMASKHLEGRSDEVAATARNILDDIQNRMDYNLHRNLLGDVNLTRPIKIDSLPEDVTRFLDHKLNTTTQYESLSAYVDEVVNSLEESLKEGRLFSEPLVEELLQTSLKSDVDRITTKLAQTQDALWKGGTIDGVDIPEGAIPFMTNRMRVGNETRLDQFMKSFFPFWNYTTRGGAAWLRIAIEHPEYLLIYNRYLKYSRGRAFEYGMVDSKGRQLPSTIGKVPLFSLNDGTDIWVALDSAFPFLRYVFAPTKSEYDDTDVESMPTIQQFVYNLLSEGKLRGLSIAPWFDTFLTFAFQGEIDQYSNQTALQKMTEYGLNLFLPSDLLPPNCKKLLTDLLPDGFLKIDGSEVPWHDYLVEQRLLENALSEMRTVSNIEEKQAIYDRALQAISGRESNSLYRETMQELQQTSYYTTVAGWFTGAYPKLYTPGQAELYRLRNSINVTKNLISNEIGRQIFYPDISATQLYDRYTDSYTVPEGQLYHLRSTLSWVKDDEGKSLVGQARREELAIAIEQEQATQAYYAEKQRLISERDAALKALNLPVGALYADPLADQIWDDYAQAIFDLEFRTDYDIVYREWAQGLKPEEMVEAHYENLWMLFLRDTKPTWIPGESNWEEYQTETQAWEENLQRTAQRLAPLFMINITTTSNGTINNVDANAIVNKLVKDTTIDSYNAWNINNDSIDEAIYRAWDMLYLDKYYAVIEGLTGSQTKWQAYTMFKATNPTPTTTQIIEQVKQIYGNKFSDEELQEAIEGKEILDIDEYQKYGQSTLEQAWNDVWNIRTWAGSKTDRTKLENEFISLGGNMDMLDGMYSIAGGVDAFRYNADFKDETKVTAFLDTLIQAANNIGIQPLTGAKLAVAVNAEKQNEKFKQMMTMEFGDTWEDIVYPYLGLSSAQKKLAPASTKEMAEFYYDLRDQFAREYPDWAAYYASTTTSFVDTTYQETITQLANEQDYAAQLDQYPSWVQAISTKISPFLLSDIHKVLNGTQAKLEPATITYLTTLIRQFPQYKNEMEEFISRYK